MKMPNSLHQGDYQGQRWFWIELLGFELEDPDYGVSRLCDRAGLIPHGVSLMLSDPDFVYGHSDDEDRIFPPWFCSYGGHPYNEERSIQPWTARHLKGLIKELQARGIKVFFTHFECGDASPECWAGNHFEVRHTIWDGRVIGCISPYKRLADGRPYADFYLPQMVRTVKDYGFDGFHAGDGFAHPRPPLFGGDFSDDSIEQYLEWGGSPLPSSLKRQANGDAEAIQQRAEWLWRERRASWIEFQRQRTVRFWSKAAELLHAEGKLLFLNTAWTRDPIEAIYRYGVDYRALAEGGVDGFFAETAAAVQEYAGDLPYLEDGIDGWDPSRTLTRFATKLMLLRAAAPTAEIVFMNGIKDTNEAWSGIRHAPTNVESEMLLYTGLFQVGAKGTLTPSSSGLIVTLADGLAKHDWDWMRSRWDLGGSLQPTGLLGAAVYWSDAYPAGMVEDYVQTRLTLFQSLLWKLIVSGAPVLATVRPEHLADWKGPLLVIHPHLVPENEWQQIMSRKDAPVITLGRQRQAPAEASDPSPVYRLTDSTDEECLELAVYNGCGVTPPPAPVLPAAEPFDAASAEDPYQWLYDLPARAVAPEFLQHAAEWITAVSGGVRVLKNQNDVRAWGYVIGENRLRVHVRNDGFYYRAAVVEVGRPVTAVKTLTAFPGSPVDHSGGILRFKLAGKSMAIFEVEITD